MTIVERSATLLSREDPRVGEILGERLRVEGIDVRTGATVTRAYRDGSNTGTGSGSVSTVITLDDGTELRCDIVVVGTGRRPGTLGLGLDAVGIDLGDKGQIAVDEHCRAADGGRTPRCGDVSTRRDDPVSTRCAVDDQVFDHGETGRRATVRRRSRPHR